jgi:GNAT superfamily N-acetyltransferase
MKVEELKEFDRAKWSELYHGYADFYKMPMNDDILDRVWSWIGSSENKFNVIGVYSEHNELIGFMHFSEQYSPLRGGLVGFLHDLFVQPDYRGSGAVQILFKELKLIAAKNDWLHVRWLTATDNSRARKVYDRLSEPIDFVTYQMPIN